MSPKILCPSKMEKPSSLSEFWDSVPSQTSERGHTHFWGHPKNMFWVHPSEPGFLGHPCIWGLKPRFFRPPFWASFFWGHPKNLFWSHPSEPHVFEVTRKNMFWFTLLSLVFFRPPCKCLKCFAAALLPASSLGHQSREKSLLSWPRQQICTQTEKRRIYVDITDVIFVDWQYCISTVWIYSDK